MANLVLLSGGRSEAAVASLSVPRWFDAPLRGSHHKTTTLPGMADRSLSNHAVGVIAGPLMNGMISIGRLPREQGEVKFLMVLKSLLGIAGLFLALNFDAVVHAEVNGAIPSIGGRYFHGRVEIPVPAFAQDDPRWSDVRLGPSTDTLGDEGCAVTSAAMVAAFYGIKTDPQQLNAFLTRTGGFTGDGLIHWSRVPSIAPAHLELAYNGGPSYELIDSNLLAGNPVIALIPLPDGGYHFVVIVGKEGRDYLIRDPAASPFRRAYHLRDLTDRIAGLCFFRTI